MAVHKADKQFICCIEVCMAKDISLIGRQDIVALNLKLCVFNIMQWGFGRSFSTRETQLLEYITIRRYFLDQDTEYFFTTMLRMQCRGKGEASHSQGERKEHLVFCSFFKKKGEKNKSRAINHLVEAGVWSGYGESMAWMSWWHLRRGLRWSLPVFSQVQIWKGLEAGGRAGTRAPPAVKNKCFLATSAPCLITGSLLFSRFRGTCLRSWSQFSHTTSGPWQQLLPPNRDSSSPLE